MTGVNKSERPEFGTVVQSLKQEYNQVQERLKDVESNIRKLTGREPAPLDHGRSNQSKRSHYSPRVKSTLEGNLSEVKQLSGDEGERDEGDDEAYKQPPKKLQSSIVPASRILKRRVEAIEEQKNDLRSHTRNKRMFGLIMGTLMKFQSEESERSSVTKKRSEIEQKLEKEAEMEKAHVHQEKTELLKERRLKQAEMQRLQMKVERIEVHEHWERTQQPLSSFIQTKSKPCIFYLPKKLTPETEKRLKDTKDKCRMIIAEKRAKVQKELDQIDSEFNTAGDVELENEERNSSTQESLQHEMETKANRQSSV